MCNFVSIVERLIEEKKITKTEFYEQCGISASSMSTWRSGKSTPNSNVIKRTAHYFGVTPQEIIDGTAHYTEKEKKEQKEQKEKAPAPKHEGKNNLFTILGQLNEDELNKVEEYADLLLLRHTK